MLGAVPQSLLLLGTSSPFDSFGSLEVLEHPAMLPLLSNCLSMEYIYH